MNPPGSTACREAPVFRAAGAVITAVLVFGPGLVLQRGEGDPVGAAPRPAQFVLAVTYPKAQADSKRRKRTRARLAAQRRADEERRKAYEKVLEGTKHAELPADCAFDSFASISSATEIYTCGGVYYQRFVENGVAYFQGHAVGIDRGDIRRARVRRALEKKKRLEEARKKREESTKTELSSDCAYDSFASVAAESNVYTCGGVQFSEVRKDGVTSYARRATGAERRETPSSGDRTPAVRSLNPEAADEKPKTQQLAALPKGCAYDTYVSFFTSSNVYACNGLRYRQVRDKGTTRYEVLDL